MSIEIIRITDVYFTQSVSEEHEDKMHIGVITPQGPKELWVSYEDYSKIEAFLMWNTGNYFYEESAIE